MENVTICYNPEDIIHSNHYDSLKFNTAHLFSIILLDL
jgi:hypothetical protein